MIREHVAYLDTSHICGTSRFAQSFSSRTGHVGALQNIIIDHCNVHFLVFGVTQHTFLFTPSATYVFRFWERSPLQLFLLLCEFYLLTEPYRSSLPWVTFETFSNFPRICKTQRFSISPFPSHSIRSVFYQSFINQLHLSLFSSQEVQRSRRLIPWKGMDVNLWPRHLLRTFNEVALGATRAEGMCCKRWGEKTNGKARFAMLPYGSMILLLCYYYIYVIMIWCWISG